MKILKTLLGLLLLAAPLTAQVYNTPRFVQGATGPIPGGGFGTCSVQLNTIQGDALVGFAVAVTGTPGASDSLLNSYIFGAATSTAGGVLSTAVFVAPNIKSGFDTITFTGLGEVNGCAVFEYSGVDLVNPLDQISVAYSNPAANPAVPGPITTTNAHDLIFTFLSNVNANNVTVPAGYNTDFKPSVGNVVAASKPVVGTGTFAPSWTYTGSEFGNSYAVLGLRASTAVGFETLTGVIKLPDTTNYNGWLNIKMNRSDIKNICNHPVLSIPTVNMTYQIVNSIPVGLSNVLYASQDCMLPRVPYYVEISNNNHVVQSTDNWYVPNVNGSIVDIGGMQESKFTGPIQVAVPQAIISTPAGNQTITQLAGTSLTINGTVNFTGTVGFITPIAFTTISANAIKVNGASGASAPLDVNGFINASAGYLVGGSGGAVGQALVSDGTSFKPGTVSVKLPSLQYQNVAIGGVVFPQRGTIAFDGSVFKGTDAPTQTIIGLAPGPAGTAGTYVNVNGFTLNQYGNVSNVTFASAGTVKTQEKIITSGICTTGTSSYATCSMGPFTWPLNFPDTNYAITCQMFSPSGVSVTGLFVSSKTSSQFGLTLQNGTSSGAHAVTVGEIDCVANHL